VHCWHGNGFTLVELLIVVIILGILAAVVVPQFESSTQESREAVLSGNLTILRTAIEFYHFEHDGQYPDGNEAQVVAQLTENTDKSGDPGTGFGPYLRTGIPRNPLNNSNKVKMKKLPSSPNDSSGWYYDDSTGEIRANSTGIAPSGIKYIDL